MNARLAFKEDFSLTILDRIFSMGKGKINRGKIENTKLEDFDSNEKDVNAAKFTTPGIYLQELPDSAPSVIQVKTAIPAFIGYTEKGPSIPTKIISLNEYKNIFGNPSNDEIGEF